jgi:ubiquinone/menaquinone biosynthesis C-methylase UbiE
MINFVDNYCKFPALMRRPMWRVWHKLLIMFDREKDVNFMNYGYAPLNGDEPLKLKKEDEQNRYCIQLYDHVVRDVKLENKRVVEIGSGRGGGADYIARYYRPKKYTGIDISAGVIEFCNKFYKVPGLSFQVGRAEKIPLEHNSHDAVVNVESARCYSDTGVFFSEVHRILQPGGYFLFADMMEKGHIVDIKEKLIASGFSIKSQRNITQNVASGLEKDSQRRESIIHSRIPGFLRKSFASFAGTKGTRRFDSFVNGKFEYWSFVLVKN